MIGVDSRHAPGDRPCTRRGRAAPRAVDCWSAPGRRAHHRALTRHAERASTRSQQPAPCRRVSALPQALARGAGRGTAGAAIGWPPSYAARSRCAERRRTTRDGRPRWTTRQTVRADRPASAEADAPQRRRPAARWTELDRTTPSVRHRGLRLPSESTCLLGGPSAARRAFAARADRARRGASTRTAQARAQTACMVPPISRRVVSVASAALTAPPVSATRVARVGGLARRSPRARPCPRRTARRSREICAPSSSIGGSGPKSNCSSPARAKLGAPRLARGQIGLPIRAQHARRIARPRPRG